MTQEADLLAEKREQISSEIPCHVLVDDDGYSLTRYIQAEPRMYEAARFTFRPVTPLRRARLVMRKEGLPVDALLIALCDAVAQRIISWNCKDQRGNVLGVTSESVQILHPVLQQRLFNIIIYSSEGGDLDPEERRTKEQMADLPNLLADDDEAPSLMGRERKN